METVYIGYWANDKWEKSEYPFPEPSRTTFFGLDRFLERLSYIESNVAECEDKCRQSICRLCSGAKLSAESGPLQDNGSREYILDMGARIIRWPEGYTHYLKEHSVHPSNEFYNLINRLYSEHTKSNYDRSGRKRNKNNWKQERAHKYMQGSRQN